MSNLKFNIPNTPANNLLMMLGGALLLLLLISWVDGGAIQGKTRTAKNYTDTLKNNYQKALATNRELHTAQDNTQVLEKQFNKLLATAIPKETKLDNVLSDITKIGSSLGLKVTFFKPEEIKKSEFFSQTPVDIVVVGDFQHTAQFISGVANLPYLLTIRDFEISRENPKASLSMHMTVIVVQYQPPASGDKK